MTERAPEREKEKNEWYGNAVPEMGFPTSGNGKYHYWKWQCQFQYWQFASNGTYILYMIQL